MIDRQTLKLPEAARANGRRPRIAFIDALKPRHISFLRDIMADLKGDFDVQFTNARQGAAMVKAIARADIVWFEWCLEPAVWATNNVDMRSQGKKVIIRLHSTEVVDGRFPHQVNWDAVDHLVFVGEDIRDELLSQLPQLAHRVSHSVISNGIDCDRFRPGANAGDPRQIAWVGDVAMKKNPMLALQILRRLVDLDPEYHLHMAGEIDCPRTARYLAHLVEVMDLGHSISIYGRIDGIEAWYRDKGVLLSTTLYESFGMNIGEAMASGCWPVIHNYPGAAKTWPAETLFGTVEQAVDLIRRAQSNKYRSFVTEHYSIGRQTEAVRRLIGADWASAFEPRRYWEDRHATLQGSIRSVAHIGLSEQQNLEDYAVNADHMRGALLAKFPQPAGKVLFDAGCGTGVVSAFCADLGFHVIGADFSEAAIAQARLRVPSGSFIVSAFDQVSLQPVDAIVCSDVFFHVIEDALWAQSLEKLAKFLRLGGRLLVLEHFPGTVSRSRHVRWRSLDQYRKAAVAIGLTLSEVVTYRLPHVGAEKTLLVFDNEVAAAPPISPGDTGCDDAPVMAS